MVQAWYMDSSEEDQRLEHHRQPPNFLDVDELFKATGVEYFKVSKLDDYLDFVALSLSRCERISVE
jgi:1,2-dihydroxy-3-keto-5-methylthiopentene dioxygenase